MHGHSGSRPKSPFAPPPPVAQAPSELEEPLWDLGYSPEELDPIAAEVAPLVRHWADADARDQRSLWEAHGGWRPGLQWANLVPEAANGPPPAFELAWDFEQPWRQLAAGQPSGPDMGASGRRSPRGP